MRNRILIFVVFAMVFAPAAMAQDSPAPMVKELMSSHNLNFDIQAPFEKATLTVANSTGFSWTGTFDGKSAISFSAVDEDGVLLPDGMYRYSLVLVNNAQAKVPEVPGPTVPNANADAQVFKHFGEFTIVNREIELLQREKDPTVNADAMSTKAVTVKPPGLDAADHFASDVTIQGQLCVGNQCVASYNPTGEDLQLIANNTPGINFRDLVTSPTFQFEWEANGGGIHFYDFSVGGPSFKIEAGSPLSSLYVASEGIVGIGTNSPLTTFSVQGLDIHQDVWPAVRLVHNSSAQKWALYGGANIVGFFDENAGNTTFAIEKEAPANSFWMDGPTGNIGFRTSVPTASLHVYRNDGTAQVKVQETNGTSELRTQFHMINNGPVNTQHETGGAVWRQQFQNNAYTLTKNESGGNEMTIIASTGDMTIRGSLFTGGPSCGAGCDAVLDPDFDVETIEEHAAAMWSAGFLPAIGPTVPEQPTNITEKVGGVLNELEKAHIYIEQLHQRLAEQEALRTAQEERLARLEALLSQLTDE